MMMSEVMRVLNRYGHASRYDGARNEFTVILYDGGDREIARVTRRRFDEAVLEAENEASRWLSTPEQPATENRK